MFTYKIENKCDQNIVKEKETIMRVLKRNLYSSCTLAKICSIVLEKVIQFYLLTLPSL